MLRLFLYLYRDTGDTGDTGLDLQLDLLLLDLLETVIFLLDLLETVILLLDLLETVILYLSIFKSEKYIQFIIKLRPEFHQSV